jgi:hypothetical protein
MDIVATNVTSKLLSRKRDLNVMNRTKIAKRKTTDKIEG